MKDYTTWRSCSRIRLASVLLVSLSLLLGFAGEPTSGEAVRSRFASHPDLAAYIDSLRSAQSDSAKGVLLGIALDRAVEERHAEKAAFGFTSMVKSNMGAAALLDSPHSRVREIGLLKMNHGAIYRALWETKLRPLLAHGTVRDRDLTMCIVRSDPGEIPAREKAAALLTALDGIEKAPGNDRRVGLDGWTGPYRQLMYRHLTDALCELPGLDASTLAELTPGVGGAVKDCVLIARFSKGDVTVREAVKRMALSHEQYLLKAKAVRAFVAYGTSEDVTVLEEVARSDPFSVTNKYPMPWESPEAVSDVRPRVYYPLRDEARCGITNLLGRTHAK